MRNPFPGLIRARDKPQNRLSQSGEPLDGAAYVHVSSQIE